jgi:hypothetical protein
MDEQPETSYLPCFASKVLKFAAFRNSGSVSFMWMIMLQYSVVWLIKFDGNEHFYVEE